MTTCCRVTRRVFAVSGTFTRVRRSARGERAAHPTVHIIVHRAAAAVESGVAGRAAAQVGRGRIETTVDGHRALHLARHGERRNALDLGVEGLQGEGARLEIDGVAGGDAGDVLLVHRHFQLHAVGVLDLADQVAFLEVLPHFLAEARRDDDAGDRAAYLEPG